MNYKYRLVSAFFVCAALASGVAQSEYDVIYEKNILSSSFSTDFVGAPEPVYLAQANEGGVSSPGDDALEAKKAANGGYTDAEVAEMINNPLGNLWLFFIQNDYTNYGGDLAKRNIGQNTTLIQPVMPFQLTDNLKLIFRPVIPINSFETVDSVSIDFPSDGGPLTRDDFDVQLDRKTGLGDIVLWTALATNEMAKPPNIFGVGMTTMLDTASDKQLGTGRNSVGPLALAVHLDDSWIYGVVAQHWWSVDESKNRADVNLTDIQYIGRYRYSKDTNIGFSPNIRYNSEASSGNRWTVPVGIGMDTLVKFGALPVKVGMEVYHYVESPDAFGPEWQVRLFFVPVLPSPQWSKSAIF